MVLITATSPSPNVGAPRSEAIPGIDLAEDSTKPKGKIGRKLSPGLGVYAASPFSMVVVGGPAQWDDAGALDGMRTSAPVDRVYSMEIVTPALKLTPKAP
jgi:hypothetical protein